VLYGHIATKVIRWFHVHKITTQTHTLNILGNPYFMRIFLDRLVYFGENVVEYMKDHVDCDEVKSTLDASCVAVAGWIASNFNDGWESE
jgi:hypothetical protein